MIVVKQIEAHCPGHEHCGEEPPLLAHIPAWKDADGQFIGLASIFASTAQNPDPVRSTPTRIFYRIQLIGDTTPCVEGMSHCATLGKIKEAINESGGVVFWYLEENCEGTEYLGFQPGGISFAKVLDNIAYIPDPFTAIHIVPTSRFRTSFGLCEPRDIGFGLRHLGESIEDPLPVFNPPFSVQPLAP